MERRVPISVIIPARNRLEFLRKSVASVRAQSWLRPGFRCGTKALLGQRVVYPDVRNYLAVPREKREAVREWVTP